VAIKVIEQGMASKKALARFKLEQRAVASMNHRAVAWVYDAGATDQGEPYFGMEFIAGLPLTDYCDEHRLSLPARIAVFQKICGGVQHAHQKKLTLPLPTAVEQALTPSALNTLAWPQVDFDESKRT